MSQEQTTYAYDWKAEAEKEGSSAAKLGPGRHHVHISRLVYGDRSGRTFQSKSGDIQMMIVFEDAEAREASMMITLNHKAGFVLARTMAACDPPLNLERMTAEGVIPEHFGSAQWAEQVLLNRRLEILVEKGKDDKYPEVTPIVNRPKPVEQPAQQQLPLAQPPTSAAPPQSAPPPPPPPPATSVPPSPLPAAEVRNEEDAWALVMQQWPGCEGDAAKTQERNNAWFKAMKDIGKSKIQFTSADWRRVVDICTCPF